MRKLLITLLLAGAAATPALAWPHHNDDSSATQTNNQAPTRQERQQARDDARAERAADRPQIAPRADRQVAPQGDANARANFDALRAQQDARQAEQNARRDSFGAQRDQRIEQVQQRQQGFEQQRAQRIEQVQQRQQDFEQQRAQRQAERADRIANRPLVVSNVPRPGTQPPLRAEGQHAPQVQWNTGWRHDNHYDWQNYRHHHRSLFHFGFYYDPYGWGYYPFQIGWRLWPAYYGNQFWINDPWTYRLPYAPAGLVWVRYWNDALLVDTWSGEVVDVIPDFFW